jgi:hypothetical protein
LPTPSPKRAKPPSTPKYELRWCHYEADNKEEIVGATHEKLRKLLKVGGQCFSCSPRGESVRQQLSTRMAEKCARFAQCSATDCK